MQPIKYHKKPSRIAYERNLHLLAGICFAFVVLMRLSDLSEIPFGIGTESWWTITNRLFGTIVFACGSVLMLRFAILSFRRGAPSDNFFCLDERGVTVCILGKRRHWPWRELSAFGLRRPAGHRGKPGKGTIIFRLLGGERTSGLARWFRSTKLGAIRWSADNFDAPIDEIAAKLNDYRDRALGT